MGGGGYENFTAIGGRNAATAGVAGATLFVPKYCLYGRLDTDLSGGMAHVSPQALPTSFERRRIVYYIPVDGVGSPVASRS